jgi:hypothetical protein
MGPLDVVRDFGRHYFDRVSREAYGILCGADDADEETRKRFRDAFGISPDTLAATIAAALVATAGLAPAIAVVVAVIVLRRFGGTAYAAMCDTWKDHLPAQA